MYRVPIQVRIVFVVYYRCLSGLFEMAVSDAWLSQLFMMLGCDGRLR